MSHNGKYVSASRIIENVYRRTKYDKLEYYDIVEWIAEALDLIGSQSNYIDKITNGDTTNNMPEPIEIANFKGLLPCDLHIIKQCREYDFKYPMRYGSDTFLKGYIDEDSPDLNLNSNLSYTVNDSYIFTSFQSGKVEMAYSAFALDDNGMPLIPDDTSVMLAIEKYIILNIDRILFRQGKLNQNVYNDSKQEYTWYIGQSQTSMNMPNLDQMESIKNMTMRLLRNENHHNTFYRYMNLPEHLNFNKYNNR